MKRKLLYGFFLKGSLLGESEVIEVVLGRRYMYVIFGDQVAGDTLDNWQVVGDTLNTLKNKKIDQIALSCKNKRNQEIL